MIATPDSDLRTSGMGLRFTAPRTEAEYKGWRIDATRAFVQVGLAITILNWLFFLLYGYLVVPDDFNALWPVVAGVALPALALPLIFTLWTPAQHLIMPFVAVAHLITGCLLAWQVHEVANLDNAPGITSGANIIVMFFGFTILRMPPRLAAFAVTPYFILTLYLLYGDYRSSVLSFTDYSTYAFTQVIAFMNGVVVVAVLEFVTRGVFRNHKIIQTQQDRLEVSQKQIRRYIPPAVAEQIIDGNEAAIAEPKRRRVTVLFSDIVGFTDMADRLDAESLTQILNEYMAAMADIVEAHGGTLNEFAGDGLMALFGAPAEMAPEAQAVNALHAAQAMQARLPALNEQWLKLGIGEPVQIRAGINTGVLSVGSFGSEGRMTYTAIGLQTNVAARIQSHCEPGSVLLSAASWQLVKGQIPCEPRGEVECKGVHYPVKVYAPTERT